jgi:hypothetical protein
MGSGAWVISPFALPFLMAPRLWLARRRAARTLEIEGQLADWLVNVSAALRAGNSLGEALLASVAVSRPPVCEEVELVMREYGLGVPLDEGLDRLCARVRSRALQSAIVVLRIARRTGGDVPATLERAASSLREMARLVKPGGAVVLTLAAFDALRGDHNIYWNEVRRYTPDRARRLLATAGLRAERVSFMFGSIFPMFAAARLLQRVTRPLRGGVNGDIDIRVPAAPVNGILTSIVEAEARLAQTMPMPIGSSLLVVGRKPY